MSISIVGSSDGPTSVFLAGKIGNMFFIPAVFILALFYSIYFIKQIAAGRKGIQTRQLGKGKIGQNHGAYSFHGNFFRCTGAIGFSFFRLEFYADACKNSRYCGRNSRRFDFSCGGAHYEKQLGIFGI